MVELHLAKVAVVGSNPIARSIFLPSFIHFRSLNLNYAVAFEVAYATQREEAVAYCCESKLTKQMQSHKASQTVWLFCCVF